MKCPPGGTRITATVCLTPHTSQFQRTAAQQHKLPVTGSGEIILLPLGLMLVAVGMWLRRSFFGGVNSKG